jgi:hypothetical protein
MSHRGSKEKTVETETEVSGHKERPVQRLIQFTFATPLKNGQTRFHHIAPFSYKVAGSKRSYLTPEI